MDLVPLQIFAVCPRCDVVGQHVSMVYKHLALPEQVSKLQFVPLLKTAE